MIFGGLANNDNQALPSAGPASSSTPMSPKELVGTSSSTTATMTVVREASKAGDSSPPRKAERDMDMDMEMDMDMDAIESALPGEDQEDASVHLVGDGTDRDGDDVSYAAPSVSVSTTSAPAPSLASSSFPMPFERAATLNGNDSKARGDKVVAPKEEKARLAPIHIHDAKEEEMDLQDLSSKPKSSLAQESSASIASCDTDAVNNVSQTLHYDARKDGDAPPLFVGGGSSSSLFAGAAPEMPPLLIPPANVVAVIQSEINNVLNVLRCDARYVPPLRFVEELPQDELHPIYTQLKELHETLSEWSRENSKKDASDVEPLSYEDFLNGGGDAKDKPPYPSPQLYLPPFCAAVVASDISADVTGTALQAMHKFMLYGMFAQQASAVVIVAKTLLSCSFEESSTLAMSHLNQRINNTASGSSLNGEDLNDGAGTVVSGGGASTGTGGPMAMMRRQRYLQQQALQADRSDEMVVLKVLELSSLVVRSLHYHQSDLIVGLLDTCLHVTARARRASNLLKCAAADALGQIVLHVFSEQACEKESPEILEKIVQSRVGILNKLLRLMDAKEQRQLHLQQQQQHQQHMPYYQPEPLELEVLAINSLTLINVALEAMSEVPSSEEETSILKNELCKYILQWSSARDLVILGLCCRLVYNLYRKMKEHIKVPLEAFLTGIHLRILETSTSLEEREIVLESILELCQLPGFLKDMYCNFDCDIPCANVFETLCNVLGHVAAPAAFRNMNSPSVTVVIDKSFDDNEPPLAPAASTAPNANPIALKAAAAAAEVPVNVLSRMALEALLCIVESIAVRCQTTTIAAPLEAEEGSHDAKLIEQRLRKQGLTRIAKSFNIDPINLNWYRIGAELGLVDETAESTAEMLFTAPGLDKKQVGLYLSQGPAEDYPFEQETRVAFAKKFDFTDMTFAAALRLFLSKFRLPGEAQCIDRFMEAFSKELFLQQGSDSVFVNSDAVFILAFSTIMLNTDLHNPTIKSQSRMTCEQFIRNNRGINDGQDLPEEMLVDLYNQIRESEIQMQREIGEFTRESAVIRTEDFSNAWNGLMSKKVSPPQFEESPTGMSIHETSMFQAAAKPAIKSLSSAFIRSWDDSVVLETLKGFETIAKASTYFVMDDVLNEILVFLLSHGREFVAGCISLEYAGIQSGAPINSSPEDDETMSIVDTDSPLPNALLKAKEIATVDTKTFDIAGCATYRGLLALNMGLKMVRGLFARVNEAWPILIDVLCALRDARALPAGLADLDDFADSDGNVLPLSPFAKRSQKRLNAHYRGKSGQDNNEKKGWFRSFFNRQGRPGEGDMEVGKEEIEKNGKSSCGELSANSKTLLQIAKRVEIEKFMMLDIHTRLPTVKKSIFKLLESVDEFPAVASPLYEQHTAFALELAARALLANRERAIELFPLFLAKFQSIAAKIRGRNEAPMAFLLERVVVTVLRANIHLYAVAKLRQKLRVSLLLLPALPKDNFMQHISDRMACGLAIILRSSFYHFKTPDEWKFFGDSFDVLATFKVARSLVFDGIASTIEFAVPQIESDDLEAYEGKLREKPSLSLTGCSTLQRNLFKFVYGAYQSDFSLAVPAMLCLEKTYKHMVKLIKLLQRNEIRANGEEYDEANSAPNRVPDKELWQRIAVAFYSVCRSVDPEVSKLGWECYQRHVATVEISSIPDEKWIFVLNLMINKQPPMTAESARVNTFSILGQVLVRVLPNLTQREKNWVVLTDITKNFASLAEENLRFGRTGKASGPIFEYTLQTVTYLSNYMVSPEFGGEKRYSAWASDTLLEVLETSGVMDEELVAAGAGDAATTAAPPADPPTGEIQEL